MANRGALSTVALQNLIATTLGPNGAGQITAALLDAFLAALIESFDNQVDNASGLITPNWFGAPNGAILAGVLQANFNSTADQSMTVISPTGLYTIADIVVTSASASLSGAVGGIYTGAGKTGVQVVPSSQAYSGLSSPTLNTIGSLLTITSTFSTIALTVETLYLSLTTPVGSPATATVYLFTHPLGPLP